MNENFLKYKGYTAQVTYSPEDKCLVGRVIGIKHIIGFHGDSLQEIQGEFKLSIDTYLEACKKLGKKPNPPPDDDPMVRVPLDTYLGLTEAAKTMGQSVDDLVASAIRIVYPYTPNIKKTTQKKRISKAKANA